MTVTASALRELHRIHRQLSDLRERLDRGPKQIRARQANVDRLTDEWNKLKEEGKSTQMTADRKNVDLKGGEAKILELQGKLNTCSSNKEYQALLDQIAAAEMANSVLSDEILECLERIDELETKCSEAEKVVATARQELAKIEQQVAESRESIEADVKRLEADLATAEAALPADFRQDYDRIVRAKGEDGLAAVDEDCCGGCYQKITANQQNDLFMSRAVFCRSCGRLLYLPEGVRD